MLAGAVMPLIVQYAKKKQFNPRVTLLVLSLVLAGIWAGVHYGGLMAYAQDVIKYVLEIAGIASLVYNYLKAYYPSLKSS